MTKEKWLEHSEFVPKTADGYLIYPGMKVFICHPFATVEAAPATIFNVGDGIPSATNDYFCTISENRYFNGEWWEDGNTESVKILYVSEPACLDAARQKRKELEKK